MRFIEAAVVKQNTKVVMPYDPQRHHRRSIRLRDYDYATRSAYFVTICVQGRDCLFGGVDNGALALNDAGRMAQALWEALPSRFPTLVPDVYVIMPNHFHAIVALGDNIAHGARLGDVVGAFKSLTTNAYISGIRAHGWPPFDQRLWQRNYYEHIIRDDGDFARIQAYIRNNPARWIADQRHPGATSNHSIRK